MIADFTRLHCCDQVLQGEAGRQPLEGSKAAAEWEEESAGISEPLYSIIDELFRMQGRGFIRPLVCCRQTGSAVYTDMHTLTHTHTRPRTPTHSQTHSYTHPHPTALHAAPLYGCTLRIGPVMSPFFCACC